MKAIVSQKGQVTIPKPCRDVLGLKTGAVLDFDTVGGKLVARKMQSKDVFHNWRGRGRLPAGKSVDDYLASVRG